MKKILCSLAALLVLTGCSNSSQTAFKDLNAKDQYIAATKAFEKVDSFSASASMNMTMTIDGESMSMNSDLNLKTVNAQNPTEMQMEMSMAMEGMTQTMYFSNEYMYLDSMGQKIKVPMNREQIDEMTSNAQVSEFDEKMMTNLSSEIINDQVVISYSLSEDYINNLMQSMIGADVSMEGIDVTINSASGKLITDLNGSLAQNVMDINMDTQAEGLSINMAMTMDLIYTNINNTTIDFPTDLDAYQLVEQ